jgi:hypothetical protein
MRSHSESDAAFCLARCPSAAGSGANASLVVWQRANGWPSLVTGLRLPSVSCAPLRGPSSSLGYSRDANPSRRPAPDLVTSKYTARLGRDSQMPLG